MYAMLPILFGSLAAGMILGTRFKVMVLFPALLLGSVVIIVVNVFEPWWWIVSQVAVSGISVQVGYLVGSLCREVQRNGYH